MLSVMAIETGSKSAADLPGFQGGRVKSVRFTRDVS